MNFKKVTTNKSVVNEVVKQIKQAILSGELKAGDKIPTEVELVEQFNIGRNSIREAIKILVALGILEVKRGQGTFVVEHVKSTFFDPLVFSMILEPKSNYDLYELRLSFDSMILFLIIDKLTEDQITLIENNIQSVIDRYKEYPNDIDFFVQKDLEFHKILMDFTDNPLIIKIGKSILDLFPDYIKKSISQEAGAKRSIENHLSILQTIKDKDKSQVLKIVETSLREWKNGWKEESSI